MLGIALSSHTRRVKYPLIFALENTLVDIYPSMESADAKTALLSLYLSRNAGTKSVPSSPRRSADGSEEGGKMSRDNLATRPLLKRPRVDLFYAGGKTIYGLSKACPTLAALARIEAGDERLRVQLLEAQWTMLVEKESQSDLRQQDIEMAEQADEMFRLYIDTNQCSEDSLDLEL